MNQRDSHDRPPRGWGSIGLIFRALQVRLRFVIVLAVAFFLVGKWDAVRDRAEHLYRLAARSGVASAIVSNDTEYFCPMDPGVLSDWPGKCGICNMALVRRKRGEAVPLPSGVVARMQFSPYRILLAGLRTTPIDYQPLARDIVLVGVVERDEILIKDCSERELSWISEGQNVQVFLTDVPRFREGEPPGEPSMLSARFREGKPPGEPSVLSARREPRPPGMTQEDLAVSAKVKSIREAEVALVLDKPDPRLRHGMRVTARLGRSIAEIEPFRSQPVDPPALRKGEPRTTFLCPIHPEVLALSSGKCPVDGKEPLEPRSLRDNQRIGWWCPTHPKVVADNAGESCAECGGMKLVPKVISYRPLGKVLAVPESAVVDTGVRAVVYVETMPGMFDGVEVELGPRCGEFYPVIRGLEPGMRVATAGAFLIDAETRLNPALASTYFGAGRKEAPPSNELNSTTSALPEDIRALAAAQKICPVTKKPLGSMGTPLKVSVAGRVVLICCEGCEGLLLKSPEKYLAGIKEAKSPAVRP